MKLALEISIVLNIYLAVWVFLLKVAFNEVVRRWDRDKKQP